MEEKQVEIEIEEFIREGNKRKVRKFKMPAVLSFASSEAKLPAVQTLN